MILVSECYLVIKSSWSKNEPLPLKELGCNFFVSFAIQIDALITKNSECTKCLHRKSYKLKPNFINVFQTRILILNSFFNVFFSFFISNLFYNEISHLN